MVYAGSLERTRIPVPPPDFVAIDNKQEFGEVQLSG